MAFQFSHEFHRNWLAASKAERSRIKTDLNAIVELLKPETELASWQKQHGIYEKNTSKAEQVSLFDEPDQVDNPDTSAKEERTPETSGKPTTQLTSHFLKKVIQEQSETGAPDVTPASTLTESDLTKISQSLMTALQPTLQDMVDSAVKKALSELPKN